MELYTYYRSTASYRVRIALALKGLDFTAVPVNLLVPPGGANRQPAYLAINPQGNQIWLAAERERRGLISIKRGQSVWDCEGPCVLLSEAGQEVQPAQFVHAKAVSKDFADLALFNGKLFTLERNAFQICRRDAVTAKVELCWSFADETLTPNRRYAQPYGLAEALVLDAEGVWLGIDNNFGPRADGEKRPVVYRFAAPAGGWGAQP